MIGSSTLRSVSHQRTWHFPACAVSSAARLLSVYGPLFCKRPNKFSHHDSIGSQVHAAVAQQRQ
jgi:hypothetical protein